LVPLESFGERFQLTQTVGKLSIIASECGEIDKAAESILKSFTSSDRMQFDRKHRQPIQADERASLWLLSVPSHSLSAHLLNTARRAALF
jgi:phage/plasmid-associated DNA primase